jgi:hypothetical protein
MKVLIDAHKGDMMQEATMVSLVKNVADTLEMYYPGHAWAVGPSNDYSMLAIWNEALSMKYGMWIRINEIDPEYRNIMRWAGELLERANVTRGKMNPDELMNLKRDITGEAKFDG